MFKFLKAIKDYFSIAVVRKQGSEWCVFSKTGKNLGCYKTKDAAEERLRQIEFFKHKGK